MDREKINIVALDGDNGPAAKWESRIKERAYKDRCARAGCEYIPRHDASLQSEPPDERTLRHAQMDENILQRQI